MRVWPEVDVLVCGGGTAGVVPRGISVHAVPETLRTQHAVLDSAVPAS